MAEKDIYISKIHGAKIRDEELTQRVASLEASSTTSTSGATIPTIKILDSSTLDDESVLLNYAAGLGLDVSTLDENDERALSVAYLASLSGVEPGVSPIYCAPNAADLLKSSTSLESTVDGNKTVTGELTVLSKAYDTELDTTTTSYEGTETEVLADDAIAEVVKSTFPFPFIINYGNFSQIPVGTNNGIFYKFTNPNSTGMSGNAVAQIMYLGDFKKLCNLTENKFGVKPGVYYQFSCMFSIFGEKDK